MAKPVNAINSLRDCSRVILGLHNIDPGSRGKIEANSTGTFYFTGLYTQAPGTDPNIPSGEGTTGSSLADLLLGMPQQTSLQAPFQKSYLRENVIDFYGQDDWRVFPRLTVNLGLRAMSMLS